MSDPSPLVPSGLGEHAQAEARLLGELRAQGLELERQNAALRQAQAELEQSRDRYRDLYEFAPVGYLTLTRSGLIAEANITAATLLGVECAELHDRRFDLFVAESDRPRWLHKFSAVMARGGLQVFEMALCGPGSGEDAAQAQVQVACLRAEPERSDGAARNAQRMLRMTLIDISERKRLGDELEQYRGHLESLVQRRTADLAAQRDAADAATRTAGSFLANLGHALRTPVNSILGLVHLLRRSGVSAQQREKLDRIDFSSRQLTTLIDGVLDLARLDSGQIALEAVDFRVAELRQSIDAGIGMAICAKGLTWATDFTGLPEVLHGDVVRLGQALLNYLNNAYRFTERGGIVLEARLVEDREDSCVVRFAVRDSGAGVARERQPALFAAPASGSGGLGLVLTRNIAVLMGGEVGFDSTPGQGSCFWLTARLDKVATAGVLPPADGESGEECLRRRHAGAPVLLVEDQPATQEIMRLLLDDAGLRVDLAGNGAEAVERAQRKDYALILMDVQMPQLDGLAATRAIRALPGRQALPIVAMTASVAGEDRRACLAAGMNDFIAKPVAPELLFATLSRWLDLAQP